MACVLPQLMSQLSVSSLDFLPRSACVPWWTEVTAVVCSGWSGVQWNGESEKNCPHVKNCRFITKMKLRVVFLLLPTGQSTALDFFCKTTFIDWDTASSANNRVILWLKVFEPLRFISCSEKSRLNWIILVNLTNPVCDPDINKGVQNPFFRSGVYWDACPLLMNNQQ